ncbi:MAG: AI-2E family transporter [Deltaproteobacteria bacterium]|nr:AI-2E family transporter [Deltaproteobacteria bacterium]
MQDRAYRDIILWFFLALFLASAFMLGKLLWPFLSVIVMGAVVTSLFKPVYKLFNRKMSSGFSSLLTCTLVFILLFLPTVFFVGLLSKEAFSLYQMGKSAAMSEHFRSIFENSTVLDKANHLLANFDLIITADHLNQALSEIGKVVGLFFYQQASSIASNALKFFVYFFFMLLIVYYLFIDGDRLMAFIIDLSPLPNEQDEKLIQKFKDMAGAVIVGNGVGGLIQGSAGGIVFWMFGLKSAFMWGVVMSLLAFIPIIGVGVVFIPTAAFLILKGRIAAGIFFVAFYMILTVGVDNLLKPRLVGQQVKMHTLLVFFSIIGGLKMFGIIGIIYGPLVITAFLTLTEIYYASYRELVETAKDCK